MSANIEHLRAVGRAATEGPWERWTTDGTPDRRIASVDGRFVATIESGVKVAAADADFVTTARNEWDGLLDEVEALRRWKAEAMSLFDGMQDLGRALGLPLGTLITGPVAVKAAEALRAKVARVEALAEAADVWVRASALRAALADQSAQDGLSRAGTTSVASGATGDTEGAQRGAQGIEGGKA